MSANPVEIARENAPSQPVVNNGWYLHSQGRQFGPLSEDEMRCYFRASMVHAGDAIAIAGQHGTTPAAEVAALLGMPPPAPAVVLQHAPTTIVITETGAGSSSWVKLVVFVAIVAFFGIAYFTLVLPLRAQAESQAAALPQQASTTAPVAVAEPLVEPARAFPAAAPEEEKSPFEPPPTFRTSAAPAPAPPAATPVAPAAAPVAAPTPGAAAAMATAVWRAEADRLANAADWTGLEAHASKWTATEPSEHMSWWFLCVAHAHQGKWDRANEARDRALAITWDRFGMRWRLANLYLATNKFQESARILTELNEERPGSAGVLNDLGIAQSNLGEYDEAVAAFEKAVKLDPGYRKGWRNLAQTYAYFGYMDKARAALAKANGR